MDTAYATPGKIHALKINQRGSVLTVILILILTLTIASSIALKFSKKDVTIYSSLKRNVQSFYVAEAGIERAKAAVKKMTAAQVHTLLESGGNLYSDDTLNGGDYSVTVKKTVRPGTVGTPFFVWEFFSLLVANVYPATLRTTEHTNCDVTVRVLGTEFAAAGPVRMPIQLFLSTDNGGTWNAPFGTNDILEKIDSTRSILGIAPGTEITVCLQSWTPGWAATHTRWTTLLADEHFIVLKNGDTLPSRFKPYPGVPVVKQYLRSVSWWYPPQSGTTDSIGIIHVGEKEVVYLCELDTLGITTATDFQDAVLLVKVDSDPYLDPDRYNLIAIRSCGTFSKGVNTTVEMIALKTEANMLRQVAWKE